MAILTNDELKNRLQTIIGERTDDEALQFVEDVSDTLADHATKLTAYDTLDSTWRKKYRDRFFSGGPQPNEPEPQPDVPDTEPEPEPENPIANITIEDLFREE